MTEAAERFLEPTVELLQALLPDLTFIGGSVIGLLITDPGAPRVRPTLDVDVIVAATTISQYASVEERLRALGFTPDQELRCRYWHSKLCLDILPVAREAMGVWNRWLPEAARTAAPRQLVHTQLQQTIRLVDPAMFVALKLEAFRDRGNNDVLVSHDMEDILSLVDGRPSLSTDINAASPEVASYIREEFTKLLQHDDIEYAMEGMLSGDPVGKQRLRLLARRMQAIAAGEVLPS